MSTNKHKRADVHARHSLFEDAQGLITGTLFVALGVAFFRQAGMVTGGAVGIAFLLHYASGLPFGALFFCVNLPFYWLAYRRMGRAFTIKTLMAISMMSALSELLPRWMEFAQINVWFCAVAGGLLVGTGMLILFRHRSSVGGLSIMVLYLQEHYGLRAGYVQAALDCIILLTALIWVSPERVGLSLIGMIAMNATVAVNHRPGRYVVV